MKILLSDLVFSQAVKRRRENEHKRRHSEHAPDTARLCDKEKDGHGFYICVKNGGPSGKREYPFIHAYALTKLEPEIEAGCFDATDENPPKSADDVIDADKKHPLPHDVRQEIVEWANEKSKLYPAYTNWYVLRTEFKILNPELF